MAFLALIALISGFLTVLSPCVLPILPIILASGVENNKNKTIGLILGIVLSFTIASLSLSIIIQSLGISADFLRNMSVLILLIIALVLVFPSIERAIQKFMEEHWRVKPLKSKKETSFISNFFVGFSLGIVWVPCVGPILATVATLATLNTLTGTSIFIAFSYGLGIAIALYLIASGSSKILSKFKSFSSNRSLSRKIFGYVLIFTAFFIFFGFDRKIQVWTLSNLPSSWTQLASNFESKFPVISILNRTDSSRKALDTKPKEVVNKVKLSTDFTNAKVKKEDLIKGCFGGKDCIPSLDSPKFETFSQADMWMNYSDTIFVLSLGGETKVYPQKILNWHEIVNDTINNEPIAVTFCPLCGSAIAFKRTVNGVVTQFGVSGFLHNSDLVMYDRYEGSLWQQISGEAIVGPAVNRNEKLTPVLMQITTWGDFKQGKENKDIKVLSIKTGFNRDYNQYPYGTYESDGELYFGVDNLNTKLPLKEVVYGVEVEGVHKAYPLKRILELRKVKDTLNNVPLLIEAQKDNTIKVKRLDTNKEIVPLRLFWFAWASFYPDTLIFND